MLPCKPKRANVSSLQMTYTTAGICIYLSNIYFVISMPLPDMSYASFHGKRIRHPVLSRRAMYYSRNIRHFHRSAHQDLRRYPIPHLRTRRTSPLQRTYPLLISAQNVIRPGRSGNPPDSYPTTACAMAGIRSRIGRVRRHPHRPHAVARPHGPGHPYLVRGVVRRRPPPFSFASTR